MAKKIFVYTSLLLIAFIVVVSFGNRARKCPGTLQFLMCSEPLFGEREVISGVWRYRITVNVETPEGIKSGSAVREISNSAYVVKKTNWPGGNSADVRGEAVVIDLGDRGKMFALIDDNSDHELYDPFHIGGTGLASGIRMLNNIEIGRKAEFPMNNYWPKFVTFTDMSDPTSIVRVFKKNICDAPSRRDGKCKEGDSVYITDDKTEELFGKGVKIRNITVERTDDPVTWGEVDRYLNGRYAIANFVFKQRK